MTTVNNDPYWTNVVKQKIGYKELDDFKQGEAGLQYYPVPDDEWLAWKKEQDRKALAEWEKQEAERKKEILTLNKKIEKNGQKKHRVNRRTKKS